MQKTQTQTHSADIPKWSALLVEAVNKPGTIMKAYSAFHNYSLGNQLLACGHANLIGPTLGFSPRRLMFSLAAAGCKPMMGR